MTTIEKIREDIANLTCDCINGMVNQYAVLQIIDKYAEQEPTIGQLFSCEEVEELRNKIWKQVEQEPTDENLHREREQAYMQGYEDASKRFRQEPCDDVVSRQAVCDYIAEYVNHEYSTNTECEMVDAMIDGIQHMPSVRPQEQTGHWILLDECANSGYYCSECQKKLVKEGWSKTVKKIKFCPNCGAKMVEPQESEDKE